MKAGVVTYKIEQGKLTEGKWTHKDIGYQIAREVVAKEEPTYPANTKWKSTTLTVHCGIQER